MTVHCRPAGPGDIDGIAIVRSRSWRGGYAGIVPQTHLDSLTPETVAARMRSRPLPGNHVAEVDGRIVGWSAIGPYHDEERIPPPAANTGEVYAIYVLPDSWGTGVGRALLTYSLELLAADGFDPVLLWVLEGNARARRFYEAAGFAADGARHIYSAGGADLPKLRYRYRAQGWRGC
jgi:GNAT superfamily N-acetyltransferase